MLEALLKRFQKDNPETPSDARERAIAVLLLEVARADDEHHPLELKAVRGALASEFGVEAADLDGLLAGAKRESQEAISLHEYVQTLNDSMPPEEKRELMQSLWKVAYADGSLDPQEEYTLRKLADLLYVPHQEFIRSKLKAADS